MEYLSRENLFTWLDRLAADYEVFVPVRKGEQRYFQSYTSADDYIVVGEARTIDPLKGFFTRAREKVAEFFNHDTIATDRKPLAIVGVKACDLHGFVIQDQVFLDERNSDPFYALARQDNLIIAADCTCALDTCFCLALDHRPYPQAHFDVNLSTVAGGYIVETGSHAGRHRVSDSQSLFRSAATAQLDERAQGRQQVEAAVRRKVEEHDVPHCDQYPGMIRRNYESNVWQDEAGTCVECGACNTICPTCHCFQLADRPMDGLTARFRQWDACLFKDFATVAGGGNPRPRLWMRLRNRFEKKFDFFPEVADHYACTGCGRCISACPAKIDIRRVLRRLADNG